MEKIDRLRSYGLFDAKVPRYTSYPPANHFETAIGQRRQGDWLRAVPDAAVVSLYIHIPFCKRLCWFCACRTQGTKTMRPVDAYVDFLRAEVRAVRAALPQGVKMGRLHLGGGTPTILAPTTMSRLLGDVFTAFATSENFEFSVEIDPTEAPDDVLGTLVDFGLHRASLGVQDFAPAVQAAIGRAQSLAQSRAVIGTLRDTGVAALNLDLLYGLPAQTLHSFRETLDHVIAMQPDRLAIYGYAHVPWMSRRQVMIREDALPGNETRFALASLAQQMLPGKGYDPIGIDHFALPGDTLSIARTKGRLRRNFQGYTDDPCDTLIGLGASAISRFPQGYLQNAIATSAYQERIAHTRLAAHNGYQMRAQDHVISRIIQDLLCRFSLGTDAICAEFPGETAVIRATSIMLMRRFPDVFFIGNRGLEMHDWAGPLVRIVASAVDRFNRADAAHSSAI